VRTLVVTVYVDLDEERRVEDLPGPLAGEAIQLSWFAEQVEQE
jgi:hypothetical protein